MSKSSKLGKSDQEHSDDRPNQLIDELEVDRKEISSPTLARLIEEVRNDAVAGSSYNRSYHRHNR